jgi:hypothetical protein
VKKSKADVLVADWLIDKIDANDIETLTAFRNWLRSGRKGRFECYVSREAWVELLENSTEETLH